MAQEIRVRSFDELLSLDAPSYLRTDHPLYERKPVTDLWNRLTDVAERQLKWKAVVDKQDVQWLGRKSRLLQVSGPPGSGKSSAAFAWAHKTCLASGYSVAWIDMAKKTSDGRCWFLQRGSNSQTVTTERVQVSPDQVDASIIILDGVRSETIGDWEGFAKLHAEAGAAVMLVSCEGVRLHGGDMNNIADLEHRSPSWTMKEYQHASRIDAIWEKIANEALGLGPAGVNVDHARRAVALEEKYPFAGHSARFMFNMTLSEVKSKIRTSSEALDSLKSLRQAMRRRGNKGSVNTLTAWLYKNGATPDYTARFLQDFVPAALSRQELSVTDQEYQNIPVVDDENCLVSTMAAREVIKTIETDVSVLRSAGRALGVRAVEGYALEASFSKTLRDAVSTSSSVTVFDAHGVPEEWSAASFRSHTENVFDAIVEKQDAGSWFWIGGFQAGFDAVHIYETGKIRFVQLTAGKTHEYLFSSINSLLQRLAFDGGLHFTHVDFVILRPVDDDRDFSKGEVSGRLDQGWNDFADTPWNTRDPSLNARILKTDWSI